ncbi:hydrolase [Jidongwangia harbinensis]|uniref:hydrolase n=1 Tax=Jidongwangia harbinensis TaxID=2878561 RepID=UPI001CD92E2E|nr:hydrolase [Jidongwangia harbinensis]MCA2213728.1 hydrolase [Jidongwangia harbinensis]
MGAERESVMQVGAPGAGHALDLTVDAHVHTGFAAGRDSVGVIVSSADRAGLTALTFADQAGPDTAWLPAYADAIRRASRRTELTLRIAAEVEVVRPDGWLALPADLGDLEALSVAVSRLPYGSTTLSPRDVRGLLADGRLTPEQVAEILIEVTVNGLDRAARYAPTQLARPLGLLAEVGLDDSAVTSELLGALIDACWTTGTAVEISEAWRSPSVRVVTDLRESGVPLMAASDARYADVVGRWQYVRRV